MAEGSKISIASPFGKSIGAAQTKAMPHHSMAKTQQPKLHDMHKHRMSWISMSRYKMSHLSLTEQLHTELRDLGAVEIMIGMIEMLFGIPLIFSESYSYPAIIGAPWFTGVWYLVSGSLTIHLIYSKTTVSRWIILIVHIITGHFSAAACVIFNLSLFYLPTTPFNFFVASPMVNAVFLMIFSLVEFVISFLVCYLHIKLLRSGNW